MVEHVSGIDLESGNDLDLDYEGLGKVDRLKLCLMPYEVNL